MIRIGAKRISSTAPRMEPIRNNDDPMNTSTTSIGGSNSTFVDENDVTIGDEADIQALISGNFICGSNR